ncbi:MAG: PAS domain-containing protein [Tannerellaceae bacterium]|jgi:signal transduction histidine kinase|nr:PAS domain-containing protein [Tannerellaceae bacterium]
MKNEPTETKRQGVTPQQIDFQSLTEMLDMGWWEADVEKNAFCCSDYVAGLLELEDSSIDMEVFYKIIREDYRARVIASISSAKNTQTSRQIFPVYIKNKTRWVAAHFKRNEEGCKITGMMHTINRKETHVAEMVSQETVKNLIYRLNGIAASLQTFMKSENLDDTINHILNSLVTHYNAERAYIFEYFWDKGTQSCTHEAVSRPGLEEIQNLTDIECYADSWWNQQVLMQRPIILNSLDDLPEWDDYDRGILESQNIKSLMVVPFINQDNTIRGYAGIDIVDRQRNWTDEDFQWFASLMQIINICIELSKSKAQIQEDKELLRSIYANLPVGFELYDRTGLLVQTNDKALDILGLKEPTNMGKLNIFEHPLIPADVKKKIKRGENIDFSLIYDFNKIRDIYGLTGADRSKQNLTVKIAPIFDDNRHVLYHMLLIINNTDTTNAYLKIQEFEEYFSLINNLAKVGYFRWNLSTNEGFAISQWFINLGKPSASQMTEDMENIYGNLHPEDFEAINAFYKAAAKGKVQSFEQELRVLDTEGDTRWLRCTLIVREDKMNEGIELIGVSYDITELKEMILAKDKAETLDRLKSAFLANMSHEIRTPLNSIIGFSDLLAETNDEEERREFITIIRRNNDLLLKLVSDILDLSKIESGTFEFTRHKMYVNTICDEVVQSFRNRDMTGDVELLFDRNLPEHIMFADPRRVTQILMNFITNSLKFTRQGHVKVGYELQPDDTMLFFVEDTGAGISPENIEKVFERFVKLNAFAQGTGLGLSICKGLVEEMGGTIGLKSEVDKGSCFWFTLPRFMELAEEED